MSNLERASSLISNDGSLSDDLGTDTDVKVPVCDRLKRYVNQKRLYNYFGPFTAEEVSIPRVRRDEEGVGLYDIHVQCLGNISWTITLRYAQLYESYKWQVKYDKELKLPLTFQFPPKKFLKTVDDAELEARREGLEKWINGRINLVNNYESECEIMKNIEKEMSFLLKVGQHGPSLHQYNRNDTVSTMDSSDMRASRYSADTLDVEGDRDRDRDSSSAQHETLEENSPIPIIVQDFEVAAANKQFDESKYEETQSSRNSCKSINSSSTKSTNKRVDVSLPIKEPISCNRKDTVPVSVSVSVPTPTREVTPASSYLFSQCRSVWVPKNWLYVAVSVVVCTLWALDVHVVYTLLFVCCCLESSRRLEDHLLFANHADIRSDREYSLTGMVRFVFIGLIMLCYLLLHALHFVFARRSRTAD